MGKTSAEETLMQELMLKGCDKGKAKYLIDEAKKEWKEKNRRREFLFAKPKQEPTAFQLNQSKFKEKMDAIAAIAYGNERQQTDGSPLGPSNREVVPYRGRRADV